MSATRLRTISSWYLTVEFDELLGTYSVVAYGKRTGGVGVAEMRRYPAVKRISWREFTSHEGSIVELVGPSDLFAATAAGVSAREQQTFKAGIPSSYESMLEPRTPPRKSTKSPSSQSPRRKSNVSGSVLPQASTSTAALSPLEPFQTRPFLPISPFTEALPSIYDTVQYSLIVSPTLHPSSLSETSTPLWSPGLDFSVFNSPPHPSVSPQRSSPSTSTSFNLTSSILQTPPFTKRERTPSPPKLPSSPTLIAIPTLAVAPATPLDDLPSPSEPLNRCSSPTIRNNDPLPPSVSPTLSTLPSPQHQRPSPILIPPPSADIDSQPSPRLSDFNEDSDEEEDDGIDDVVSFVNEDTSGIGTALDVDSEDYMKDFVEETPEIEISEAVANSTTLEALEPLQIVEERGVEKAMEVEAVTTQSGVDVVEELRTVDEEPPVVHEEEFIGSSPVLSAERPAIVEESGTVTPQSETEEAIIVDEEIVCEHQMKVDEEEVGEQSGEGAIEEGLSVTQGQVDAQFPGVEEPEEENLVDENCDTVDVERGSGASLPVEEKIPGGAVAAESESERDEGIFDTQDKPQDSLTEVELSPLEVQPLSATSDHIETSTPSASPSQPEPPLSPTIIASREPETLESLSRSVQPSRLPVFATNLPSPPNSTASISPPSNSPQPDAFTSLATFETLALADEGVSRLTSMDPESSPVANNRFRGKVAKGKGRALPEPSPDVEEVESSERLELREEEINDPEEEEEEEDSDEDELALKPKRSLPTRKRSTKSTKPPVLPRRRTSNPPPPPRPRRASSPAPRPPETPATSSRPRRAHRTTGEWWTLDSALASLASQKKRNRDDLAPTSSSSTTPHRQERISDGSQKKKRRVSIA